MDTHTERDRSNRVLNVAVAMTLRAEMGARGVTIRDLAPRAGIHENTLANYLNLDQPRAIPLPVLAGLVEGIGMDVPQFWGLMEGRRAYLEHGGDFDPPRDTMGETPREGIPS